jgi:predicted ATPase
MLRKIEFENFMCLKDVSVELEPFTILVGKNAAGKSAIFKGLVTLARLVSDHPASVRGQRGEFFLETGVTLDDLVWKGDTGLPIKFRAWFHDDGDKPGYSLELKRGRAGWSVTSEEINVGKTRINVDEDHAFEHPTERLGMRAWRVPAPGTLRYGVRGFVSDEKARPVIEPILQNARRFGQAWRYRPSALDVSAFTRTSSEGEERSRPFVAPNGRGLPAVLQELQGRNREVFSQIEEKVRATFTHVRTIGFDAGPDGVRLNFMTTRSNNLLPAPQEADGVLLATFLLWRLYTAEPPITICLEDPENGLYPELLEGRYELLRTFTNPADGDACAQVLVSTHSIEFLRTLRRHHSDFPMVRVVEFREGEGTRVESLRGYRDANNLLDHFTESDSLLPSRWSRSSA